MKRAMRDEGDVKDAVKKLLTKHGWFHFMPPANAYGAGGISDHLACKMGVFLAVECKFGKRSPTALQTRFIGNVRDAGGIGIVVRDATVDDFEWFLIYFDSVNTNGLITCVGDLMMVALNTFLQSLKD